MHIAHALPAKDELVEEVMNRAIQREVPVEFRYVKRGTLGPPRIFSPFVVDDEFGTVIGWDHGKDELRRFSLSKIAWPVTYANNEEYVRPREKG